jgi:hypothetical protein
LNCKWGLPGGSGTTKRNNTQIHISHKITHHSQTKHSTQHYTSNKGLIVRNENNAKKVKLIVRDRVSHIYKITSRIIAQTNNASFIY